MRPAHFATLALGLALNLAGPSAAAADGADPTPGGTTPDSGGDLPAGGRVFATFSDVEADVGFRVLVDAMEVPATASLVNDPRDAGGEHVFAVQPTTAPASGSTLTVQWCAADCDGDRAAFDNLAGFNVSDASETPPPAPLLDGLTLEDVDVVENCDGPTVALTRFRVDYQIEGDFADPVAVRLVVSADGTELGRSEAVAQAPGGGVVDFVGDAPADGAEVCATLETIDLSGTLASTPAMQCTGGEAGTSTGAVDADGTSTGDQTADSTGGPEPDQSGDDEGCACNTDSPRSAGLLFGVLVLALRRRRNR